MLDQATSTQLFCRPAENACERAVRHADLIGPDADGKVVPAMTEAARSACESTAGCAATKGNCSCPCALLGKCKCECGGDFLPRCVLTSERSMFEGRPPNGHAPGALGDLGRQLVALRLAAGDKRVEASPLPDPASFVGQSRQTIEAALGTPRSCGPTSSAPCTAPGQLFYSLVRQPSDQRGGSVDLVLAFDAQRTCTTAQITRSR